MNENERALWVAGIAAVASLLVGLLTALAAYLAARRDRRRTVYGEAVKAALAWEELLYRVRRRDGDAASTRALIDHFHKVQDEVTYFQAWISSESAHIGRSYRRLVTEVKDLLRPHIVAAWNSTPRSDPAASLVGESHPDATAMTDRFLRDVRAHLSPLSIRKLGVWWRNRG